ncbi:uncharacterized protein LOC116215039 [Punica granatum]|uniref:UspA domain-containing protein n=2 Tax=Punica granatum TaxID=22663 RepID=A0A218VY50_PUNGR|nr:uncharacterized protein LOC116215039 [Punica granatum]OWM65209.1 hypothetical protein CDL15_Pgr008798 [Punica granatum]PKI47703.1 hypothetical protein CRG98_031836 [Punica granatum]
MGRGHIAIPRFGIRLRSPPPRVNHISSMVKTATPEGKNISYPLGDEAEDGGPAYSGNRVMVVVDSSLDSEGALEWALTHTVQSHQDCIVLLHVIKPFDKDGAEHSGKFNLRAHEVLHSMRNMCRSRRPSVKVEVATVEGEKKGQVIVEEAKRQRVSLLVLGQRRRPAMWQLVRRLWTRKRQRRLGMVEYCIQNASCMAIAMRRKSRKLGGYLITTKRHKNFWLLA